MRYFTPKQINSLFPVIGLANFGGGVIIKRQSLLELNRRIYNHKRGIVKVLSRRSLNKLALLVRSSGVKWRSVLTLSYGVNYPLDGKIAKRHLNAFLVAMKREFGAFEYFWVLEFQGRGAVHFHLACTLPEPDIVDRQKFARIWTRISVELDTDYCSLLEKEKSPEYHQVFNTRKTGYNVHVHSKSWEAVKSQDGMGRYLAKYANKLKQKNVPKHYQNVGRFWGVSRGVKLPDPKHFFGSDQQIREALRFAGRDVGKWECLPQIVLVG
jgi:hypothetical protein